MSEKELDSSLNEYEVCKSIKRGKGIFCNEYSMCFIGNYYW